MRCLLDTTILSRPALAKMPVQPSATCCQKIRGLLVVDMLEACLASFCLVALLKVEAALALWPLNSEYSAWKADDVLFAEAAPVMPQRHAGIHARGALARIALAFSTGSSWRFPRPRRQLIAHATSPSSIGRLPQVDFCQSRMNICDRPRIRLRRVISIALLSSSPTPVVAARRLCSSVSSCIAGAADGRARRRLDASPSARTSRSPPGYRSPSRQAPMPIKRQEARDAIGRPLRK